MAESSRTKNSIMMRSRWGFVVWCFIEQVSCRVPCSATEGPPLSWFKEDRRKSRVAILRRGIFENLK